MPHVLLVIMMNLYSLSKTFTFTQISLCSIVFFCMCNMHGCLVIVFCTVFIVVVCVCVCVCFGREKRFLSTTVRLK